MTSILKKQAFHPLPRVLLVLAIGGLVACQSSSQSSSSSSMPMPSMPSSSSSSSSSSASLPSPSSSSSSSSSSSLPSPSSSSSSSSSSSLPSPSSSSSSSSSSSLPSVSSSSSGQSDSDSAAASASSSSQGGQTGTISFPAQTGSQSPAGSDAGRDSTAPQDGASDAGQGQQTAGGNEPYAGAAGDSPSQSAGTDPRLPGDAGTDGDRRDGSTGDLNNDQSGNSGSTSGGLGSPSGDYSLETLPNGGLSGTDAQGNNQAGTMTTAEQAAVLDERLRRGYEDFDGFILGERERAQREANEAGSVAIGQQGSGQGGAVASNQPQTMPSSNGASAAGVVSGSPQVARSSEPTESFPPPEDIPSGRDDDVVARQLREAAMSESDPELRAALWDEYRRYTGLPVPEGEGEN